MKAATPGSAAGAKFPFKRFTGAVFHFAGACADVQVFPPSFPFVLQSLPFFKRPSPGVHPWSHCQGGGHSLDVSAGALEDQFAPRSRELDGLDPETVLGATEWTARFGQPSWRGYRALFFFRSLAISWKFTWRFSRENRSSQRWRHWEEFTDGRTF